MHAACAPSAVAVRRVTTRRLKKATDLVLEGGVRSGVAVGARVGPLVTNEAFGISGPFGHLADVREDVELFRQAVRRPRRLGQLELCQQHQRGGGRAQGRPRIETVPCVSFHPSERGHPRGSRARWKDRLPRESSDEWCNGFCTG